MTRRYKEAEDDYLSILDVAPDDPAAWNNLGNTNIGLGNYDAAAKYFQRASNLSPTFSFAAANRRVPEKLCVDGASGAFRTPLPLVFSLSPKSPPKAASLGRSNCYHRQQVPSGASQTTSFPNLEILVAIPHICVAWHVAGALHDWDCSIKYMSHAHSCYCADTCVASGG